MKKLILIILLLCTLALSTHALKVTQLSITEGEEFNKSMITLTLQYDPGDYVNEVHFRYNETTDEGTFFTTISVNTTKNLTQYTLKATGAGTQKDLSTVPDMKDIRLRVVAITNNTPAQQWTRVDRIVNINYDAPTLNNPLPKIIMEEDTINQSINLSTYFSEPQTLTYSFTEIEDIALSVTGGVLRIEPEDDVNGNYTLTITATDGLYTTTANTTLNITAKEDPPRLIEDFDNFELLKDATAIIDLEDHFEDPEGANLTYNYSISSGTVSITKNNATIRPSTGFLGNITMNFTANDGLNTTTGNTFVITVVNAFDNQTNNTPPAITSATPLVVPPLNAGDSQTFTITATDSDGDTLRTNWYVNNFLEAQGTNTFTYTFATEQAYTIVAQVSDGEASVNRTWSVTIGGTAPPTPPPQPRELCGNGVVDPGETCSNCALDVRCLDGESCVNNVCQEEESNLGIIILSIVGVLIIAAVIIALYLRHKKKQYALEEFQKTPQSFAPPTKKPPLFNRTQPLNENARKALTTYTTEAKKRGMTKAQIREELLKKGWKQEQISEVL